MRVEEDILISKAQAGDREALNQLVSSNWQQVYRFASYKTGNLEDAQEITQETFYRAFRSLSSYKKTAATFKTYLSRIALNLIADLWRKKVRSPAVVDIAEYQELADQSGQPDEQAISSELRDIITKILKQLPADQRQTVELRIIAGLPVKDAAIAMGKTEAAVKMLQQRALKNLRKLLTDQGIVELT